MTEMRVSELLRLLTEHALAAGDNPVIIQDQYGGEYAVAEITHETGDIGIILTAPEPPEPSFGQAEDSRVCLACGLRAATADEWCRATRDTDHRWSAPKPAKPAGDDPRAGHSTRPLM